jgi:hypothetical protein
MTAAPGNAAGAVVALDTAPLSARAAHITAVEISRAGCGPATIVATVRFAFGTVYN